MRHQEVSEPFVLDDYMSVYLNEKDRAWVEELFDKYTISFLYACYKRDKVKITSSSVMIARYLREKTGETFFPSIIRGASSILGESNWMMEALVGPVVLRSVVPVAQIGYKICRGDTIKVTGLEGGVMEISV